MIFDLSDKLEQSESQLGRSNIISTDSQDKKTEDKLTKATKDGYVEWKLTFSINSIVYFELL